LYEDRILDRNTGQMVNPNMEWYLLAGMSDIPQIDIHIKQQPERGVIGIGEPPTVSTAAAIACAVRNAIGATIRHLPVTPQTVLAAINETPSPSGRSSQPSPGIQQNAGGTQ
jgi:xanthine dehydrogenase YagR molybdenum-binding subunit